MRAVDEHISIALNYYAGQLADHFNCDVVSYTGSIYPAAVTRYREEIEALKGTAARSQDHSKDQLVIVLTSPGGVVETVEKLVQITRHHYADVSFVVPDMAMSAGTVWCMSGDRIWMDYTSSLGPIDPQVQSASGNFVPALGYLDKVDEFIRRSQAGALTTAELVMLKGVDLAELRRYEQARELSITLLKQWLVRYKFKNWTAHRTTNPGTPVTQQEKESRAEQIAKELASNSRWHSHGRMISMPTLKDDLRLEIDDFSLIPNLRASARMYHALLTEYLERSNLPMYVHSARS